MQQKVWCILLLMLEFNMAVPLQQPITAAGHNNTADPDDLDSVVKGASDESDVDAGYANGDADMTSAHTPSEVEPFHYILSLATGMFVAITKSGRVQAHAQMDRLVSQFYRTHSISDDGKQYVTLESRKYSDLGWYLTVVKNRKIRGSVPSGGNERFEMVSLESAVALKANINNISYKINKDHTNRTINATNNSTSFSGSGSGSGMNSTETSENRAEVLPHNSQTMDCYVGFALDTGRASCYNSTDYSEVRLLFIDGFGG